MISSVYTSCANYHSTVNKERGVREKTFFDDSVHEFSTMCFLISPHLLVEDVKLSPNLRIIILLLIMQEIF